MPKDCTMIYFQTTTGKCFTRNLFTQLSYGFLTLISWTVNQLHWQELPFNKIVDENLQELRKSDRSPKKFRKSKIEPPKPKATIMWLHRLAFTVVLLWLAASGSASPDAKRLYDDLLSSYDRYCHRNAHVLLGPAHEYVWGMIDTWQNDWNEREPIEKNRRIEYWNI